MYKKTHFILILTLAMLAGAGLWGTLTQAAPEIASLAGGSPSVVAYQGEVRVSGTPYSGDGYFKFAVVDAAGSVSYWSNDGISSGGSEPTAAVQLAVSDGLFSILLGDTTLGGMTQALTADVFSQPDRYLRVWFSSDNVTFNQLTPDTRITAVPYALQAQEAADADTVDGLHANQLETHYQNVVIVAKSGGDYTSVQAAINGIADAAADNPYLVWVAPGVYEEQVTMKSYVHLQGAGQEMTFITNDANSSDWPPTEATLILASDTSLRDLTLGNSGAGDRNVALLATAGMTRVLAVDVTARVEGSGTYNYAIFLTGSGTSVTLQQITALAENASSANWGLYNFTSSMATLRGGSFTGRGGNIAFGIYNGGSDTTLNAENVTALGENGTSGNYGLSNYLGEVTMLHGGSFTGRGGTETQGISISGSGATLTAESVTALGENGSDINTGLLNSNGAAATLRGGIFTGRGGADTYGINNSGSDTTLEAESVTTLTENGSVINVGLYNDNGATAKLHSGSFTAYGGDYAYGIYNRINGAKLEAESVTALAANGSNDNFGLLNYTDAATTLRGGSFTGRGGTYALGISNSTNSTMETESVTALGENGTDYNYGLTNIAGAEAMLHGGSFTGHGGDSSYGIYNIDSNTTLMAKNITALGGDGNNFNLGLQNGVGAATTLLGGSFTGRGGGSAVGITNYSNGSTLTANNVTILGENGISSNTGLNNSSYSPTTDVTQSVLEGATYSIRRISGSITVSNSRLVGGAVSGSVTCVAVSRNMTFNANGCP